MLFCEPFSVDKLGEVQSFYCGDEEWERRVSEFIKGNEGEPKAITLIKKGKTEAWLYKLQGGAELVGFGALTKRTIKIGDVWHKSTLLTAFGIQKQHQGKPDGPREQRYSTLMMSDLLSKAIAYNRPIWELLVHKNNSAAQKLYERVGFVRIEEVRDEYDRMFMRIL